MDQPMSSNTAAPLQMVVPKMSGDMRFVGIMYIIIGAFYCLTIIGAVIGVPLIICGIRLREAADAFGAFLNSNDASALAYGFERQGRFFFIFKVLFIVGLVLAAIYFLVIIIALLATGLSNM
nr:DUF5362 domain-containing protein [candidate division KSB1 bacterium]